MPNNVFNNSYATTTLIGQINALHGILNLPYDPNAEYAATTLNTKYNVYPTLTPAVGEVPPLIGWFGIGINGYNVVASGPNLLQPYYPKATNMDIFTPIPFVVRPVSADLTPAEKANYRMRTVTQLTGVDYAQYWLKKIVVSNSNIQFTQTTPSGVSSNYLLDPNNLTPTPSVNDTPDVLPSDTIVKVGVDGSCVVTGSEVIEVVNALYQGDLRKAIISEMGFYTGIDKVDATHLDTNGNPVVYTELIHTQLAAHRCFLPQNLSNSVSQLEEIISFRSSNPVIV